MPESAARTGWESILCDSLETVFADQRPRPIDPAVPTVAFAGERVSFQLAVLPPPLIDSGFLPDFRVAVLDAGGAEVGVGAVDLVPVTLPAFDGHDDGYLRDAAGMFPDPIRPVGDGPIQPFVGQWRAVWIDVDVPRDAESGDLAVLLRLTAADGAEIGEHTLSVRLVGCELPALDIVNAQWLHCDGLAAYYGDEVFGEDHWSSIDGFIGAAVEMGVNAVLTPVWTPPLDTAVGTTRLPTQLVGIAHDAETGYRFDFSMLRRWLGLCRRHGVGHVEIPHLFTQWGARATPAIYVQTATGVERRFGWDVAATDPAYRGLLEALLPELRSVLDAEWGLDRVFFHVSDEPPSDALPDYLAARAVVADLLEGCTVVDALSDIEFVQRGAVDIPIAATTHAEPFLAAGVDPFWLYYCVDQNRDVSNRFMALPAVRNRIIGAQLFLAGASGFLHWGLNFYNAALSTRAIDPFTDTCAGGHFPAGDAFIVYPGPDRTPWPSTRSRVFAEAMSDHRAMQLLRELVGEQAARQVVDPAAAITLARFSPDPDDHRRMRAAVAARIDAILGERSAA